MSTDPSDEQQADPAAMLALMQQQRRRTVHWANRSYATMLITWAAAWAIGFGAIWSADVGGGNPWLRIPAAPAWIVFGVATVSAIVVSVVAGVRSGVGTRGPSRLSGAMYGWSWTLSMTGAGLLIGAIQRTGADATTMAVTTPALFVLIVGILYLAGGALVRSPVQYALGIVMIVTAIVASYAGTPTNYLVYATVGPLAMVVVATLMLRGVIPAEGRR
ncbi:hypothetical protein [Microbacterium oleivorans]|uniref:Uncharacterized protein n=1 Tax=Microbacterium oleivorans TaxID=273677 RepID=A0A7D5ITY4_9MICO|nr:hypothetical protein [Microbacterium oleivorans]QLD12737.1 hypothetical protein HW566_13710 [Microbacterium oleivorans]